MLGIHVILITFCLFVLIECKKQHGDHSTAKNNVPEGHLQNGSSDPHNRHESFIGCTMWKRSTETVNEGGTVQFDGIILNDGAHFNPLTGRFTCPMNGVYYVSITVKVNSLNPVGLAVSRNDELFLHLRERYNNPMIAGNTLTNSGVLNCLEGQHISVTAHENSTVHGDPNLAYTTLTVMYISREGDYENPNHVDFTGFTALAIESQTYNLFDVIQFDDLYNEGGHYVPELNRFVCPTFGFYLVQLTARMDSNHYLNIGVEYGTLVVLSLQDDSNSHNQVHNSAVVRCEEGGRILVKALGNGSVSGHPTLQFTTFTVMLLNSETSLQERHTSFVGFSAFKRSTQVYSLSNTIIFDGVPINEGNNFQLNRFTCPIDGIYYIAVTAKKDSNADLMLNVDLDRSPVFSLEDVDSTHMGNIISNAAVVKCIGGDMIQLSAAGSGSVYGSINQAFTTFMVFLIH